MSDQEEVLVDLEQRLAAVETKIVRGAPSLPLGSNAKGPRNLPKPSARKAARLRQRAGRKANRG
jgi:hypothetical protein